MRAFIHLDSRRISLWLSLHLQRIPYRAWFLNIALGSIQRWRRALPSKSMKNIGVFVIFEFSRSVACLLSSSLDTRGIVDKLGVIIMIASDGELHEKNLRLTLDLESARDGFCRILRECIYSHHELYICSQHSTCPAHALRLVFFQICGKQAILQEYY